jgi:hypothetical protein
VHYPGTGQNYPGNQSMSFSSVADPGCLPQIPGNDFFNILDPGTQISDSQIQQQQNRGGGGIYCLTSYFAQISQKNWKLFYFWTATDYVWDNWQRIQVFFTPKTVTKLSAIFFGMRDLRSIGKKLISDPGSGSRGKKATDPWSRTTGF